MVETIRRNFIKFNKMKKDKTKERPKEFSQVCVWPGTIVGEEKKEKLATFFASKLGVRVIYLEEIRTHPDKDEYGIPDTETGNRNDVIFAVHDEDVSKFAIPRLQLGIRWIEDAFMNMDMQGNVIYPEYLRKYCTWDATIDVEDEEDS